MRARARWRELLRIPMRGVRNILRFWDNAGVSCAGAGLSLNKRLPLRAMAFDAFFLILLMLVLGKLCARIRLFPDNAAEVLNQFALYVCLSAAVLHYGSKLEIGPEILSVAAVPWGLGAIALGLVLLLQRVLGWSREITAVLLLAVPLGNTSYLGYPLVHAMLGEAALPYAVIYDQFGAFLILSSYGLIVLARASGEAAPGFGQIVRRIFRFPPFIALLLALTVFPAEPPAAIDGVLLRLSDALLPIVALAVGLQLKLRLPTHALVPLGTGLALKLVLLPALALAWVHVAAMPPLMAGAVVLETAMPSMITAAALAISHRIAPTLAAALVGYSLLVSLFTLPLWNLFLQHWLS